MNHYTQYPFSAQIRRRLFINRVTRRTEAAFAFLRDLALCAVIAAGLAYVITKWWFV